MTVINNKDLHYLYYLYTWGGFYNDQYKNIHKQNEGLRIFDSLEDRETYLDQLKQIEKDLNTRHLAYSVSEGYSAGEPIILHRVVEYKKKRYYSKYQVDVIWDGEYSTADYHMECKWYPGFNDYTVEEITGEEVNYKNVKIIEEWISGNFKVQQ